MNALARLVSAALILVTAFAAAAESPPRRTLAAFESEAELGDWLEEMRKRAEPPARAKGSFGMADSATSSTPMQAAAPPAAPAPFGAKEAKAEESVTNIQTAGVDRVSLLSKPPEGP